MPQPVVLCQLVALLEGSFGGDIFLFFEPWKAHSLRDKLLDENLHDNSLGRNGIELLRSPEAEPCEIVSTVSSTNVTTNYAREVLDFCRSEISQISDGRHGCQTNDALQTNAKNTH
jgi:hypothetical protein